jgi:hypothetical protein
MDSSVSTVTRLWAGCPRNWSFIPVRDKIYIYSPQHTDLIWRRVTGGGALSPEVKRPGCGADHSLPSSAEGHILRHGLVLHEAQK